MERWQSQNKVFQSALDNLKSEEMWRAISNFSPAGIIVVDEKGRIVFFNVTAERLFGYSQEEVLGQTVEFLLPSRFHRQHVEERKDFSTDPHPRKMGVGRDLIAQRKDGTEFPVEIGLSPIKMGEKPITISFLLDITVRKKAEEALKQKTEELVRSNKDLEDFCYIASHDLQEPLHKIIAFGNHLIETHKSQLDEKGVHFLELIQKAAAQMQRFIHDLLSFAKITTQSKPFETVNLAHVIRDVLSDLEVRILETKARVEVGDLPIVKADRTQISQVFQNLIANAIKFHKKDKSPPHVKIQGVELNGFFEITVTDNGIGFDEKYFDRILQPFQRLHGQSEYEGSGMGLVICQKIIERHGGEISARSAPEKGATFIVRLLK